MTQGFILEPTYRIERNRAVELWGVLEGGGTFLIRDRRVSPYFFIRASDLPAATAFGIQSTKPTNLHTLAGEPVVEITVPIPADTPTLRDGLEGQGILTYEADVRFAMRYCFDRGIRAAVQINGEWKKSPNVSRVYEERIGKTSEVWNRNHAIIPPPLPAATLMSFRFLGLM